MHSGIFELQSHFFHVFKKLPVYSELVKAFYSNLEIQEGTLISEVYGIKMVIDQSLFYELT